jgi:hypothetical protein
VAEEVDGDDDSGRLQLVLGVQEVEEVAARRFHLLAWLGEDLSVDYVKLREAAMAGSVREEESERGEEKRRRRRGLGFGGEQELAFKGAGVRCREQ